MLELVFALLIKWLVSAKALRPLFEARLRGWEKRKLLGTLDRLRRRSFVARAEAALRSTERIFEAVAGSRFLSLRYFLRLAALGAMCGFTLAMSGVVFLADGDRGHIMEFLGSTQWWQMVICPAVLAGAIMCPVDFSVAHGLVRWGAKHAKARGVTILLLGLPVAYLFWGIGAGLAACLGPFILGRFFMPGFLINRIWVAWTTLGANAASLAYHSSTFTFGLLSAAVGLSTLIVVVVFLTAEIFARFPRQLQALVAWPCFQVLRCIQWFDRRNVNWPIGKILLILLAILLLLMMANK